MRLDLSRAPPPINVGLRIKTVQNCGRRPRRTCGVRGEEKLQLNLPNTPHLVPSPALQMFRLSHEMLTTLRLLHMALLLATYFNSYSTFSCLQNHVLANLQVMHTLLIKVVCFCTYFSFTLIKMPNNALT